jgi:curved DNA-binding protein CbpA
MTTTDKTPYEILDVPVTINYVELRRVYRTKIHEHLQKKISAVNFRRICRAYETLSDFDKRTHYDSHKEWISDLPLSRYTPQQLAAEPDLIRDLKQRLSSATLTKINAQDPVTGHTTLYCAARAGNVEAVKFLTEHGAEPDLSQRTKSTALHVAAFYGHANVVRCLLESGADYRIVNSSNNTPEKEWFNTTSRHRIFRSTSNTITLC